MTPTVGKITLSSIVLKYLDSQNGDPATLQDLHKACTLAGLNVVPAQVYAGVQTLASTGKCSRGSEKQTWIKFTSTPPVKVKKTEKAIAEPKVRNSKGKVVHSTETILADIENVLGPAIVRPTNQNMFAVALLGENDAQYILERAKMVMGREVKYWATWKSGDTTIVGFQ